MTTTAQSTQDPGCLTARPAPTSLAVPELLAPAGDWDCARAAVENGADAIYFGLEKLNARIRANNFTASDLPALMAYLHGRGVRGYACLNTLVFENELTEARQSVLAMIRAGVDAVIVQDIGVCRLVRSLSPDFPIHASTQMTITSGAGVAFARDLGCNLVVLARECSVDDIRRIYEAESASGGPANMPLETFVHGALCVAYSGQCLTSEALGGRSANRGECAQACRMPYALVADGKGVPLGDRRYLLSPQDLAGIELLPQLLGSGVASLKIEGRLKTPEYVANITRVYRQAIDEVSRACATQGQAAALEMAQQASQHSRYALEMAFSRGLATGWLRGINNQELVHGRFGKKRGVFLGQVREVGKDHVLVELTGALKPGDGVVFDAGKPEEPEEGGRVYSVEPVTHKDRDNAKPCRLARLRFGRGDLNFRRIQRGDRLWKTSDPELERNLRRSFTGDHPARLQPLEMMAHGAAGRPLVLTVIHSQGRRVTVESDLPLVPADRHPLTPELLRQQLGRLGGTPFSLAGLAIRLEGELHLPLSELNRLRRRAIAQLESELVRPPGWTVFAEAEPVEQLERPKTTAPMREVELSVLVRNLAQLNAALESGVQRLYCELEDPKKYREAVGQTRTWSEANRLATGRTPLIFVAPPRITKPGEEWMLKIVSSSDPDGFLIRNYDHLRWFSQNRCVADFSFNVANSLSAAYLIERYPLERLTASYDLNALQLEALLAAMPADQLEVTIHQHVPMFHMEHCVFCAFLSQGTDYTNCGRPCDRHVVALRDRVGTEHPVKADAGCRNTVFNGLAQTGAEYVRRFRELGARHFRIEFLDESPETVTATIASYRALFEGRITGRELWRELRVRSQLGVTRGPLDRA